MPVDASEIRSICLFEDALAEQFYPLTLTRPVYDLRCGIRTLREKWQARFPKAAVVLWCRELLQGVVAEANPGMAVNIQPSEPTLYLNGRWLAPAGDPDWWVPGEERVYVTAGRVVAACLQPANAEHLQACLLYTSDAADEN